MNTKERDNILKGAKEAFFLAMLDGYAGGEYQKSTKTVSNRGNTITITFVHGLYVVEDQRHTASGSNHSAGTTIITFKGMPVWWMSYSGHYTKEALPLLKEALKESYERKVFTGGRGPKRFPHANTATMLYHNNSRGDFVSFHGEESVVCHATGQVEILGNNKYHGTGLI